jgi:hypothetical protein
LTKIAKFYIPLPKIVKSCHTSNLNARKFINDRADSDLFKSR